MVVGGGVDCDLGVEEVGAENGDLSRAGLVVLGVSVFVPPGGAATVLLLEEAGRPGVLNGLRVVVCGANTLPCDVRTPVELATVGC